MAVLAFVLFFVLLGLGVLFLAMSGGPKGARERLEARAAAAAAARRSCSCSRSCCWASRFPPP